MFYYISDFGDFLNSEFGDFLKYPRDVLRLQKLMASFRDFTDRNHLGEWSPDEKIYAAAQMVGPLGSDNEALGQARLTDWFSDATPACPLPAFPTFSADSCTRCSHGQSSLYSEEGCMIRLIDKCQRIGKMLVNTCSYHPDWKSQVDEMSTERRPQAGPDTAKFLFAQGSQDPRERFADTLPQCKDHGGLVVQ